MIFSENRLPLFLIMLILMEHFSENRRPLFLIMLKRYFETLKAISVEAAGTFSSCGNNAGIRIAA